MSGGLRITDGYRRAPLVRFSFDGREYEAPEGETAAAALLAAGVRTFRRAPRDGAPRGPLCLMGVCQECLVLADEIPVEACRLPVREGLTLARVAYAE